MKKLDELEIARSYLGKTCDTDKLSHSFKDNGLCHVDAFENGRINRTSDCTMYIAYCNYFDEVEWDLFRLTDILHDKWMYEGIDFRVNVYIKDNVIVKSNIFKYKETCCGYHGRPSGYELLPTQQELRLFKRIMEYIAI